MKNYTETVNEGWFPLIENQTIQGGIVVTESGTIVRNCTFVGPFPNNVAIKVVASEDCVFENNTILGLTE